MTTSMINLNRFIVILVVLFLSFVESSCNRNKTIEISPCSSELESIKSIFRGVKPQMAYDDLIKIMGEPNETYNLNEDGEDCPVYYKKKGKIFCHYSDGDGYLGMVEYIPYDNYPILIDDILDGETSKYGVTNETEKVIIYHNDSLYFEVILYNFEVWRIDYWLVKPRKWYEQLFSF